ncbi:hypothetical protein HY793_00705 [Candidatus Desantisbacteria bacterium]|nr:hypothetical protein [Candidatus Desantisbacteria bacterium]
MAEKNEKGALTLVLIIFVSLALFMLAASFHLLSKSGVSNAMLEEGFSVALPLAEAGAERAIWRLSQDPDWRQGYGDPAEEGEPFYSPISDSSREAGRYWVTLNTVFATPNYLIVRIISWAKVRSPMVFGIGLSRGATKKIEKLIKINLKRNPVGPRNAITTGGKLSLKANTTLYGNIQANDAIEINARTDIYPDPFYHEGRLLTFKNIQVDALLQLHKGTETDLQDVRARESIIGKIEGTNDGIFANDTTSNTDKLIVDGSIAPGEKGIYIPNPAMAEINRAVTQTHSEAEIEKNFDLAGGVHLFPNGIEFKKKVYGTGTIIVTNGHNAKFSNPLGNEENPVEMNVIVISGTDKVIGEGDIEFDADTHIKGLIYCHDNITTNANFSVAGAVICYNGDVVMAKAHSKYTLNPTFPVNPPGFNNWWDPTGNEEGETGTITELSYKEVF